jgi:hypothetical protein
VDELERQLLRRQRVVEKDKVLEKEPLILVTLRKHVG